MEKGIWERTFKASHKRDDPMSLRDDLYADDLWTDPFSKGRPALPSSESAELPDPWDSVFSGDEFFHAGSESPHSSGPRIDIPSRNGFSLHPPESADPSHTWESQFLKNDPPSEPQPAEAPKAESAPKDQDGGVAPLWGALLYREKAKSGPPMLSKLGDFLDNIWINIHLRAADQDLRAFVFCGASRGVGATFISFHLALSLALERNMKVLYVDGNMDAPDPLVVVPGMGEYPGLASFFGGHRSIESLILKTQYKNLALLPSGAQKSTSHNGDSPEKTRSVKELVDYCKGHFDVTIFDGQPALEHPSTITIAKAFDQTILICRYGQSRREVYKCAIDKLKENGVSIAGVVLNERQYPLPPKLYNLLK